MRTPAITAAIFARISPAQVGFAHFIARRIVRGSKDRSSGFSRPIVFIAVLGIVVGMAVMVLTVGITQGFQREVRAKVTGAGAHLQITALEQTDPKETVRIPIDQPFYPALDTMPGVAHIQAYATRPGIIETEEDIEGVVLKGIGSDYDTRFLREHMLAGGPPAIGDSLRPIDLLLSSYHADRLRIGLDDTITTYLVRGRDDVRPRKFRVCGVYKTGLEQIDHNLCFVDIDHLQRFAQWGLKAEIDVGKVEHGRFVELKGLAFGGDRNYTFEWPGTELKGAGPHRLQLWDWHNPNWAPTEFGKPPKDTTFTLVVHDADNTIPDTAWVHIVPDLVTPISHSLGSDLVVQSIRVERGGSGGSYDEYCGGFEVTLDHFDDLAWAENMLFNRYLNLAAQEAHGSGRPKLRAQSVRARFPEIFSWLALLDNNVVVIIVLMVVVAIINMVSALLIIILERTNMIGTLKALGATNAQLVGAFLMDGAYILGTGILLGDLLGIGLALVQRRFGFVTLPMETYYVDVVAIDIDPLSILWLNLGTLSICVLALLLPSMLVSRIAPAKAIRFT
ncbi:MAG: ABC transporter permease [Flavobacteriales bacterium]|nr:ABC transporter permease [Flavobacteriales bacterium]